MLLAQEYENQAVVGMANMLTFLIALSLPIFCLGDILGNWGVIGFGYVVSICLFVGMDHFIGQPGLKRTLMLVFAPISVLWMAFKHVE